MCDATTTVASGILPDVEGGILPPGKTVAMFGAWKFSNIQLGVRFFPPGWKPGSTAGRDACRYICCHV
jgi:hypothetical protein